MELALSLERLNNEKLLNLHRIADEKNDVQLVDFIENEFLVGQERMQTQVQRSHARVQHFSDMVSSTFHLNGSKYSLQRDTIPVPIKIKRIPTANMLVEVGIGTFNNNAYKSYLLVMDTGSTLIWTQCVGCKFTYGGHCYLQKEDFFPNTESKSYILSKPQSTYHYTYGDGGYSYGICSKETFTFPSASSSSSPLKFPNIVFGCGINNHNPLSEDNTFLIAGVLGMGVGKTSFVYQIKNQIGGRFSYCFVRNDMENPPPMYLRFGTNIKPPKNPKTLKFQKSAFEFYTLNMIDIGVNGERLHLRKEQLFAPHSEVKGLIIDSGAELSYLREEAYNVIVSKMDKYFSEHKGEFMKENSEDGLSCYSRIKGEKYNNIPGVTFYFEGGVQLDIIPEGTFQRNIGPRRKEIFCLMFYGTQGDINILGAFQQVNQKFIYNINDMTLQFGREDCAKNG
ncbi:unnamed protein product [Lupinus luteus]|uniref:ferroxidase n=1 Tax=Lupinus luteus TaxID=3873 RepID=A0AAV1WEL7_LUPLU